MRPQWIAHTQGYKEMGRTGCKYAERSLGAKSVWCGKIDAPEPKGEGKVSSQVLADKISTRHDCGFFFFLAAALYLNIPWLRPQIHAPAHTCGCCIVVFVIFIYPPPHFTIWVCVYTQTQTDKEQCNLRKRNLNRWEKVTLPLCLCVCVCLSRPAPIMTAGRRRRQEKNTHAQP